ncbi:MAG: CUAEP/CCAEP-tail radical SAM protein [Ktedonobacteraceae bacterium]
MRSRGDILLISCYELGHQPFHLASLCALLQQAGYDPVPVDSAVETLADETIREARFVAISVPMHTALRLGEQVARRVRALNPAVHICFYGLYALLNAEYLLQDTIDSAIGGEYEGPLLNLLAEVEKGKSEDVPGVSTRSHASGPWIQRTPFIVPERRSLPTLDRYARLELNGVALLAGYTETTRGCKHTCLHCPITPVYGGRFFAVPTEIVLADMRAQVAQGARHITFGDPDFFNGPTHALRITRALHEEYPTVTFDATIKVEHLLKQRRLLPELKSLGCAFVVSAVESINDTVLQRLDKGHDSADVAAVFDLMEQVGIPLRPSLLPFSPWETLDSYISLLSFIEERHLIEHIDPVHLSIRLLIPPGSALLDTPETKRWLGDLDAAAYTYRWRHPDPRMDTLHADVAALAAEAERQHADPVETFFQVKALARAAGGQTITVTDAIASYGQQKVLPHLSESWFC